MRFTILGATGFIGRQLAEYLKGQNLSFKTFNIRSPNWLNEVKNENLGHVIYCIGMTANFRIYPHQTVSAHVTLLSKLLEFGRFESLTYLSSTRVYEGIQSANEESTLQGASYNPGHLYNFSKLLGESLCFSHPNAKVVRLSNVYGQGMAPDNFIASILIEASQSGRVEFKTSPESSKDYISIQEVVRLLPQISTKGTGLIYNLATGHNTSNAEIASILMENGVETSFDRDASTWQFPEIDVNKLNSEFGFVENKFTSELPNLLNYYRYKAQK